MSSNFYTSETELLQDFKHCMSNHQTAEEMKNYLYNSLVDELIMEMIFEVHRDSKTGTWPALEGECVIKSQHSSVDQSNSKVCTVNCPHCDRLVAAARFAPHLEKCMGMGRNSSRIASRRIASSNRECTSYFNGSDDEDDDADWSGEKRKKKLQPNNRTNARNTKTKEGRKNELPF